MGISPRGRENRWMRKPDAHTMNRNPILDPTLQEILQVIKPTRADWDTRIGVIDQLRSVLQSVESLRGDDPCPFLLLTRFVHLVHWKEAEADFTWTVASSTEIVRLQFVVHARVPILKIVSWHERISCDISIDNLEGLLKSRFLFWISEIDGRFRDLVLLVKEWAKAHDINNPKNGTFNSYTLSLLVIFHLQTCVPAILPPLGEIYPRSAVDDLKGVRKTAEDSIAQLSAANIARFKSGTSRSVNRSSLSELLVSFFAKFSDINVKAGELGVCPFTGRWENISSNTRWLPKTYSLFVEDPFEQPENAARSVSRKNLDRIAQVFEMTSRRLASSDCNRNSIVVVLTAPLISQSLCRTTSLPNHHHANGVHGQSRPWNNQMQQNWSQSNNIIQNPPYWPAPRRPRPQQNWSQNNPRNTQGQTPVQGQAQTQKKSHYQRPIKNTSAGSSQNHQGHIPPGQINGVNFARPAPISQSQRGQMWRPRP
ncbi:unnamed protein product [Thlaspi arvense]|uniref:Poly(A) RNA polymerase mitochondrial-like central palm domain-containing protein n=1 Tax=Thlaspi arvense TaxID=13288 RepID=A0AAU9S9D3_THLAR|nr:unnamed protein product [Thlaspi arvense]